MLRQVSALNKAWSKLTGVWGTERAETAVANPTAPVIAITEITAGKGRMCMARLCTTPDTFRREDFHPRSPRLPPGAVFVDKKLQTSAR
jgi:hypothetical protein